MDHFNEIASALTVKQFILLYLGALILANIVAAAGGSKSKYAREGVIALLALFGGGLAVGFVSAKMGNNSGLLQFVVLVVFMSIIGVSGASVSSMTPDSPKGDSKPSSRKKEKQRKKSKPSSDEIRKAELARRAERVSFNDIDSITDEELLCAFVHKWKSNIALPALKKITSDAYLAEIAEDISVDRRMRMYALDQIKSEEIVLKLVRQQKDKWLRQEARSRIKSPETRLELYKEDPELYSPSKGNPLILKYVVENHLYADDSMDIFTDIVHKPEKGNVYEQVLLLGDQELIQMLDPAGWEELAGLCMDQIKKYGHMKESPRWELKDALRNLKHIYHLGLCESMNADIEALDGQTFNRYDEINFYNEHDKSDGITFDLHAGDVHSR